MKMICENCAFSIEVKPYNDPECPYMICASGEVVSRWIIRIQNTKINKQYRMIAIEHHITKDRILEMMLKAFREMETEINAGGVKR